MVANGEAEVGDGYDDGDLVPGHQETHQASLEHVGREEGEKDDDEGEHQAHVLHAATPDTVLSIKLMIRYQDQV